jgi:hypothetical protein
MTCYYHHHDHHNHTIHLNRTIDMFIKKLSDVTIFYCSNSNIIHVCRTMLFALILLAMCFRLCFLSKISPVTGLEWPRGFQEVKVPRFHDNDVGWW